MNYSHNIDLATTEIFSVGCYNANSTQCRYPSKPCSNDRALKENGEMHKFCDFHRAKANLNQRRLEQRRKLQKKLLQSANNDAQPSDGWLSTQSQLDMTGVMEYNALLQDASLDPISQEELSELLDLVAQSQECLSAGATSEASSEGNGKRDLARLLASELDRAAGRESIMPPKKRVVDDEKQQLEEEAMAEWLTRGLNIKDFSMDKMLKLWAAEDDDGEEDEEEALSAKQELIQSFNVWGPIVKEAKEMVIQLRDVAKVEAKIALQTAWKYAEIPPLKRRRLLREHVAHVHEMDRESCKYMFIKQNLLEEFQEAQQAEKELEFGLKKRNKNKAPLLYRFREMVEEADKAQQERILEDIEKKRRARMDEELEEKQRIRDEKNEFAKKQKIYRRHMNMNFWKKQLTEAQMYASKHQEEQKKKLQDRMQQRTNSVQDEINYMEGQESVDAMKSYDRLTTTSSLGIFDTSFEPGEWNSSINGGHQQGMDEHTVGMSGARSFKPENELKRLELMEEQSKVAMLQEKVEQLQQVKDNLTADRNSIKNLKEKVIMDIRQVDIEFNDLSQELAGPPRRDPSEEHKQQFHMLVTRRAGYKKHLSDLNSRDVMLQKRMDIAIRAESSIVPRLRAAEASQTELQKNIDVMERERHDLPMVIGQSLLLGPNSSTDGKYTDMQQITAPKVNPAELLSQITMETNFELLKNAALPANSHYKNAKAASIESWKTQEQIISTTKELHVTKSRLAAARDQFAEQQKLGLRADLVNALKRFHHGPNKLRKCIFPLKGSIEWWQNQNASKSTDVEYIEAVNGIKSVLNRIPARIKGRVCFPKHCFYRVRINVFLVRVNERGEILDSSINDMNYARKKSENLTVQEFKVYIGTDFDSLQLYSFSDSSGKTLESGSLEFEFYGARLSFGFEFVCPSEVSYRDVRYRVVISNVGSYEERIDDFREEDTRMMMIQKESYFISELVKTMRNQSKQTSSERCSKLLQELIIVEKSQEKLWDSTLIHGHYQRFRRIDYAKMLRDEIKKEVAAQIDQDIVTRKARRQNVGVTALDSLQHDSPSDVSRLNFQARKFWMIEPQLNAIKLNLGEYCSFKTTLDERHGSHSQIQSSRHPTISNAYRKEAMVVGIRYEWREGKMKLQATHKLCSNSSFGMTSAKQFGSVTHEWCQLDGANAVFLANSCTKALRIRREQEEKARLLIERKDKQIQQLEQETNKIIAEDENAALKEAEELHLLRRQKRADLSRRQQQFYTDGLRSTVYNEAVSSQVDFQIQRKLNTLSQESKYAVSKEIIIQEMKEKYAKQFADGRIALVKKSWNRKEKRVIEKRELERKERAFRIQQEKELAQNILDDNEQQISTLRAEHIQRLEDQLKIPRFERAIQGSFECEHRDVKSWGSLYDTGIKCKQCGKELSKSYLDPSQGVGADPVLNEDIRKHRAQVTGGMAFKFQNKEHLDKVENERIRLEKEARLIELSESCLYDRMDPKVIDEFNTRHKINRQDDQRTIDGSDSLYQRTIMDAHRASFQDNILFHGRLRNFNFRIHQLCEQYNQVNTLLAVQKDFLESVQYENEVVMEKLPLVEKDHARATELLREDQAALNDIVKAKNDLVAAQNEREAAYHAIEGVEEEAEFAEFHAPSLIQRSDEMKNVVQRLQNEHNKIRNEIDSSDKKLTDAEESKKKAEDLLNHLYCRLPDSVIRTKYGFASVMHYRNDDDMVVLKSLQWEATFFFHIREIVAFEKIFKQEEHEAMNREDKVCHDFYNNERRKEMNERHQMGNEENQICAIEAWHSNAVGMQNVLHDEICQEEFTIQLAYEMDGKQKYVRGAQEESRKLRQFARVSLRRKGNMLVRPHPSKFDLMRVARACEKRLAMAAVESALMEKNSKLHASFESERDFIYTDVLAKDILDDLCFSIISDLCKETSEEGLHSAKVIVQNHGHAIISSKGFKDMHPCMYYGLDRLWTARKKKIELLCSAWKCELDKMQVIRKELARREEIKRLEEEERIRLEQRRKEMLAEERWCRKFYLEEMVLYMRERKQMANAEMETREYIRLLELEAMKTKYAKMVEDRQFTSDKAARRLEIKLGKNEKHNLYREWEHMKAEDDLATQLREIELAKAQADALERQFDKYLIQQAIDGKKAAEIEANRLAERIREAQRLAAIKRQEFEAKFVQERMMASVEVFYTLSHVEMNWMNAVERSTYWRQRLSPIAANLEVMKPQLQRIMDEREHIVADVKAKRDIADACKRRALEADQVLTDAIKREEECSKRYKKVHYLNSTMDSEVLHDRIQRFKTIYLHEQLHQQYFFLLTDSIIRRAIVELNIRETQRLQEQLRNIVKERVVKTKEVKVLQHKRRRRDHMQLRRSELGKLIFGGSQRQLLNERFQQWARLWSQRVMVRASFELKHGLLMQKQQLGPRSSPQAIEKNDVQTKLSIMHDYQRRRVQCRLCKVEYTEQQNNRYACTYHPGAYELACIRSCTTRQTNSEGAFGAVISSCMMHRTKRWLCCDETDEGRYGSTGCARRFHMPMRSNGELENLVKNKVAEEQSRLDQINQHLLEVSERNLVGKMKHSTKSVITKIEQDLSSKRAIAAKYHILDRR